MTLAVLELNDGMLQIQAEDGPLYAETGFAQVQAQGIRTGEISRAVAWRSPQHSYNQYWRHLNQTPLAAKQKWARHHADIAFAQLKSLWLGALQPESLVLLAPGSYSDAQLSLLLGLTNALPCKVQAVIDSALASCLQITQETLLIDLQLHQTVISWCRPQNSTVSIVDQEVLPGLGLIPVYNSVARHISELLIQNFRYDPLHTSDNEQDIYNRLPAWLATLGWQDEVSDRLTSEKGDLSFTLRKKDVIDLILPRLANMQSVFERRPKSQLRLTHLGGWLAGLWDELSSAEIATATAGIDNCMALRKPILEQTADLHRISSLERGEAQSVNADTVNRPVSHLLYRDRALPLHRPVSICIDDQGVRLSNRIDRHAVLTLVLKNQVLEIIERSAEADIELPTLSRPGETIIVDKHQFSLIEVEDG